MDKKRILISSLWLYRYLSECLDNVCPESENPIIIHCEKNSISISNLSKRDGGCEASNIFWDFEFDYTRLSRFCRVLKHLSEQPITLIFDEDYITIPCAVI